MLELGFWLTLASYRSKTTDICFVSNLFKDLIMSKPLAPVVVYTYNRINHLQKTIAALQENYLSKQTTLYVISDGPKDLCHKPQIDMLRQYVDGITGFKEVVRVYREKNMGTPDSIHEAEGRIVSDHGCVISMEDDNIASRNYLNFMNEGLLAYKDDPTIFSICGYCPPIEIPNDYKAEYWFYNWNLSWGYAIWKKKYDKIYPLINQYPEFKRSGLLNAVNKMGGLYIVDSLLRDYKKKAIFPDAILCAKMTQEGLKSVIPTISKIKNIGSDGSGVSGSRLADKHDVVLDDREVVDFSFASVKPKNDELVAQTIKLNNGGILTRLTRRLGVYHELSTLKRKIFGH